LRDEARARRQAQAVADLAAMSARFRAQFPDRYASESAKGWSLIAIPMQEQMVGSVRTALFVISAAVGLILLIACVNVANLLLARAAARQREIAVRMALGAARARLVRQLLTESTILAGFGGVLGIALAWAGIRLIVRLDGGEIPRLAGTSVDGRVLLFSIALTLIAGIIVGLVPALQQSAGNVRSTLGEAARGSTGGREGNRLRRALVAAQVGMALLVLVAAGLLGRSFIALQSVRPGFSADGVITFQLTLPFSRYDSAAKVISLFERARSATAAIPGVTEVSAVYPLPMGSDHWSGTFTVEGEPEGPNVALPHAEYAVAMPGYFHAAGIPLIAGREFASTDRAGTPAVAIVDEALARKHWPNQSAINKRINADGQPGDWATVVGVVGHVHNAGPQSEGEPQALFGARPAHGADAVDCRANNGAHVVRRRADSRRHTLDRWRAARRAARIDGRDRLPGRLAAAVQHATPGNLRRDRAGVSEHWAVWRNGVSRLPADTRDWHPHGARRRGSVDPAHGASRRRLICLVGLVAGAGGLVGSNANDQRTLVRRDAE
jgi:putative ABC transport system permease protein